MLSKQEQDALKQRIQDRRMMRIFDRIMSSPGVTKRIANERRRMQYLIEEVFKTGSPFIKMGWEPEALSTEAKS